MSLTHTKSLELAARKAGFANCHRGTQAKKVLLHAETALTTGAIIAMDKRDGMEYFDSVTEYGTFIYDELLPMVCAQSFRKMMRSGPDPDDELGRLPSETTTEDEFEEWFHTNLHDNMYFRLNENISVDSLDQVLKLLDERSFWPAFYVRFQGKLHEFEKGYENPLLVFGS